MFTRNKEDRTKYVKADVLENFSFFDKILKLDLHLMHVEPIKTLQDLRK